MPRIGRFAGATGIRSALGAVLLLALVQAGHGQALTPSAGQDTANPQSALSPVTAMQDAPRPATPIDYAAIRFLQVAQGGDLATASQVAAATLARNGVEYWFGALGQGAPAWAKRFEFEFDWDNEDKPEFSILTVQPLYQSEDLSNTIFTQARIASLHQFSDHRIAHNLGLGYRRLLADNSVLLGVNAFHDYEWDNHHSRASLGLEGRWGPIDLFLNRYWGLSGTHSAGIDTTETPLDGYDVDLSVQLPYLPWARARLRRFVWKADSAPSDIFGAAYGLEADLHQNVQLEAGAVDNDEGGWSQFMKMRFRLASWNGQDRPVAASNSIVSRHAFEMRDMKGYTLDKVRRENKIILERANTGITISRGT